MSFIKFIKPKADLEYLFISEEIKKSLRNILPKLKNDQKNSKPLSFKSVFYFKSFSNNGQEETAEAICRELGIFLMIVDMEEMLLGDLPFEYTIKLIFREALLQSSALYFHNEALSVLRGHIHNMYHHIDLVSHEFYQPQ